MPILLVNLFEWLLAKTGLISSTNELYEFIWSLVWIITGTIGGYFANTWLRFPIIWITGAILIFGVSALAILNSWWIPVVMPMAGWTVAFSLMTSYVAIREKKLKNITMQIFEQAVSTEVAP